MKPQQKIFIAISLTLLIFFVTGCATVFDSPSNCADLGDGQCWTQNNQSTARTGDFPDADIEWEVDTTRNATQRCGYAQTFEHASCVMGRLHETGKCWVVSALTRERAKRTLTVGFVASKMTIYEHERHHCNGWNHAAKTTIRPLLSRWAN